MPEDDETPAEPVEPTPEEETEPEENTTDGGPGGCEKCPPD